MIHLRGASSVARMNAGDIRGCLLPIPDHARYPTEIFTVSCIIIMIHAKVAKGKSSSATRMSEGDIRVLSSGPAYRWCSCGLRFAVTLRNFTSGTTTALTAAFSERRLRDANKGALLFSRNSFRDFIGGCHLCDWIDVPIIASTAKQGAEQRLPTTDRK